MANASPRLLQAVSVFALFAAGTCAQDWVQAAVSGFSPVRDGATAVFDLARQEVVMFGGASTGAATGGLNDTWTWNGATWTQKTPAVQPPTRWLAAMDYDLARNVVVLFGGRIHAGPAGPSGMQNDLWEWDGTNWTAVAAINPPAGRYSPHMVYDVARGVHVMFGGVDGSNVGFDETWEYDAATTTWTQIPTATSPGHRVYAGMAYDQARQRTVLYGGRDDAFAPLPPLFWEYDGSNWTSVAPANPPGDLHSHVMVYDQVRQRIVMQGGRGAAFVVGAWEYDGVHCYHFGAEANPAPGSQAAAGAYDLLRNRTVVCGGYSTTFARTADTWERDPSQPGIATFGVGCAGSAGVPAMAATNLPTPGGSLGLVVNNLPAAAGLCYFGIGFSNTSWNSVPLPLDLGIVGLPGCTDYISIAAGVVVPAGGGNSALTLAIPNNAALLGLRYFVQAVSIEATSMLALSDAVEVQIF